MPYHIDEENSELAFEVREGNKLVIKIKSNIFSDSLELYLIKVGDNTEPTDKNVFSSLRVLKEIENLHDTILKEINSVTSGFWELKQDSQGNEYIATKYNVLTEGGLTTYGLGEQKLGTIYDGLPIDNDTIYWEEVEGSRVLKAKGSGGEAGSVQWGNISGKPTWIEDTKPTYNWYEIQGEKPFYTKEEVASKYVTIDTEQEITALKHFTAGLSVGESKKKIYEENGVVYIDADVAVTGAMTFYATAGRSVSTIMDAVTVDGITIKKENGKLVAVGGGEAGSVAWGNITGKPSVFATNIANITDLHSSWDAVLKAQKPNWLTAVSIATISDLHANWDALLKAAPSAYVTRWPSFAEVTSKPTTLSGYGITDAYTKTDSDSRYINTSGDTMTGNLYFKSSDYPFFHKNNSYAFYNIALNFESRSSSYFYPVRVTSGTSFFPLCTVSISSTSGGASLPLNNNSIRFMVRTGGWSDIGRRLIVLDHWAYSSSEITIYAIYLGEENGDCVVYLRGGVNYAISISGRDWVSSSDTILTNGNEKYPKIDLSGNPTDGRSFAKCYRAWMHSNGYGLGLHAENSDKLGGVSSEYFMRTKFQEGYYGMALPDGSDNNWIRTTNPGIIPYSSTIKSSLGTDQWQFGRAYIETVYTITTKASDWFRSTGNTGWLNETYGGGWYMTDGTWIRAYANKSITGYNIQGSGKVSANNGMYVYGMSGSSWGNGDGAYSVAVPHNENQTTLLLAYNGANNNITGSDRYFSIEVLNSGNRNVRMLVQGQHLIDLLPSKVTIFKDLLVEGGGTFYSSDIRYKSIIQQIKLSLSDIAKAPSFVYHWNKKGMKCDRLNLGGSAQYTQSILPWAVENNNGFLSMDYATVAYTFAVHTARHLLTYETRTDKKIKKLENRVKYLEKQLKKLGYEEVRTLDDQSV